MEAGGIELCEHALLALLTEATAKVEKKIVAASTSLPKKKNIYISPASLGKHDNGAGAALEGGFHGADSHRLCGVAGQVGDATELLEHLPVEHGGLCLTGNLFCGETPPKKTVNPLQQQSSPQREKLAGMALVSWHLESRNKVAVSAEFTLPGSNKAHEASSKRRPRSVTVHRSPPTHAFKAELAHG